VFDATTLSDLVLAKKNVASWSSEIGTRGRFVVISIGDVVAVVDAEYAISNLWQHFDFLHKLVHRKRPAKLDHLYLS